MHLHKWTKWQQYNQGYWYKDDMYYYGLSSRMYYELREKRFCKICNKMQDRKVK